MPHAKPKLGQNFLIDEGARRHIAAALGDLIQRTVIEIGPGQGAITDLIAPRCRHLIAIELDRDLAPALAARYRDRFNVTILEADVLRTDLVALIPPGEAADVIGNIPYYITSDILLHLFAAATHLHRAVLMMQREVAERVAATPGTRDYGLLSATTQLHARVETLFTLPPSAFRPSPKVDSTVLRLTFAPRFTELNVDPAGFDRLLKQSFAQKRKTLHNNLRAAGHSPESLAAAWPTMIPRAARAESLTLDQMSLLYHALNA